MNERRASLADPLPGVSEIPFWLDTPARPAPRPALDGDVITDLVVVGGGFAGLWTALRALEEEPTRSVVVLEAGTLAWAASGRNGGFCSASITHGVGNGFERWPDEMPLLHRLGLENLDGIEQTVRRYGIDCGFERTGELNVAVQPWQAAELPDYAALYRSLGEKVQVLSAEETRARVDSPTYLAGVWEPDGTALVDPARLVWGLADAAEGLGASIHERTRALSMKDTLDGVDVATTGGTVHARRVVLATNAFPNLLKRVRPFVVPVWDHVMVTEPLTPEQKATIGWQGREGLADSGNQFHYYRLTADDRILWGGYDALYYFGSDRSLARRMRRPETEATLVRHFRETFPTLGQVRFTHAWAGVIDTCTWFTPFWMRGLGGKVVSVQGFTGLGVGASRFGAQVSLDLLAGRQNERTGLKMVRTVPFPFPPEPLRWAAVEMTRRSIAKADRDQGRRDLWLRTLDRFGLGFDS